ncbi:MFS general substrate transporter [Lentinula aff. detonsa]|uniref:MFS general substrate transporter n=1 Tax=Lentinula aff. detonsa TaxID=2804958 RepID=A0AA38L0M9_9AGAR|nr:MFS general substrate transporter [Lentinula aff. detonsa]
MSSADRRSGSSEDCSSSAILHDRNFDSCTNQKSCPVEEKIETDSGNSSHARYAGSGTRQDPYIVVWDEEDPEDPYNWSNTRKWIITTQLALTTFTVSFSSSSYSGGLEDITRDLNVSDELAVLGISLYVLGFAVGPLLFAPMGEMYGRRIIFLITVGLYTPLHIGGAFAKNITTVLIVRLLTGIFGASPLTNAGGAVADIFTPRERGLASAIYAAVPFLGPVIGPIVGGFVADSSLGWHFNFWLMLLLGAFSLIMGYFLAPETYAPVLLRRRAQHLMKLSNGTISYMSKYDVGRSTSFVKTMKVNLSRPFTFMVTEPIVLLFAIYISVVYGTLYALFSAFPIVFETRRGWSAGVGGLAFLGVGAGISVGTATASVQNTIYRKAMDRSPNGRAPPEARLHTAMMGGVLVPIGLFWFAWTADPPVHWIVPIIAGFPFGQGVCQILQSSTAYLMDAYEIYFASAIAATIVLRSIFAAVFPVIAPTMFKSLGDAWGMSIFAFLGLACTPIPFLFWNYGKGIRSKSKYAYKESDDLS